MPNAPSSFPQFDVTATIERMSWTFYLAAKEEDNKKDDAVDRVLLTSFWGGPLASSGLLFAGLRMSPIRASDNLSQQNIDKIRGEAGWISVSDICQMKPLTHATPLAALFDYAASHELLLKDGIWTANGGPGTTGPIILYSTHQNVENKHMNDGLFYDYSQEIFPMVKNVQWADEICRNIILPSGSQRAILDFKNSGLFLLAPSDDIAILR